MRLDRLTWKAKLTILLIALLLFSVGFVFSPFGNDWMVGKMKQEFDELPPAERRESPVADRWLSWSYFRAYIAQDDASAIRMYKEFCGYNYKGGNGDDYMIATLRHNKLDGMCSPDGQTGWGPMHPRAPEAFFEYIVLYNPTKSDSFVKKEVCNYYRLFYTWWVRYSGTKRPHPMFNKYWPKMKTFAARLPFAEDVQQNAPLAAPYKEETPK